MWKGKIYILTNSKFLLAQFDKKKKKKQERYQISM